MSRYIRGVNRDQLNLFPICLDDMIAEDNVVRAIDAIVDNMDISSIGFTHSETKETGRKPYSPIDLFKLYTYSYFNGIRSSRKIEKECHRNIEVIWLINELKPDFKTIADFRKDNKKQVKIAFSNCPVKEKCTISEKGRTIQDRPFQRIADEVDKRTAENADMYKKRQRLAEHPFGTLRFYLFSG